eukprot:scaffold11693_cov2769-Chaetoceros_neogracile.AAC.1
MPTPIGTSLHASSTTTGVHKFTVRSLKTSYTSCGMTRVLVGIIVVSFSKNNDEIALKWILEAGGSFTFTTPSPDSWKTCLNTWNKIEFPVKSSPERTWNVSHLDSSPTITTLLQSIRDGTALAVGDGSFYPLSRIGAAA